MQNKSMYEPGDNCNEAVIDLCRRLVRVPSLSGEEAGVADLVEAAMTRAGYDSVERDALGSVIGLRRLGRPGPVVVLDAHMDVVPAGDPSSWTHPPFSGHREAGRVWGRGATDIKGALAALLLAIADLPTDALCGTLVVSASVGEEAMEGAALGRVLERVGGQIVVICEPTELQIGLGHKGRASLVVVAHGRAAHTSRPERGLNAVYLLAEALPHLRAVVPPLDELLGRGVMELVEIASEPFPGSSMVPYRCTARFDRRLVRSETRQGVLDELQAALAATPGVEVDYHVKQLRCYTGCELEERVFHPCWAHAPDGALALRATEALGAAGLEARTWYAPYCTNGSLSAGERGLPTLIYGPGSINDAHVVDEGVDEAQLTAAYRGYQALAKVLATPEIPTT